MHKGLQIQRLLQLKDNFKLVKRKEGNVLLILLIFKIII